MQSSKHSAFGDIHTPTPEVSALLAWPPSYPKPAPPATPAETEDKQAASEETTQTQTQTETEATAPAVMVRHMLVNSAALRKPAAKPSLDVKSQAMNAKIEDALESKLVKLIKHQYTNGVQAKGREQQLAMKKDPKTASKIPAATAATKTATTQQKATVAAVADNTKQAAQVDESDHHAVNGKIGNELHDYDSAKAGQDLSEWFDDLITRRVAVGRGRVMGGGQVHKPDKSELRTMEDAAIGNTDNNAGAASVASADSTLNLQAPKEPIVGDEFVHVKSSKDASNELTSYFDGLISRRVAIDAHKAAIKPSKSSNIGGEAAGKSSAKAVKATQQSMHGVASGAYKAPVVGNEMKNTPGQKASQDLESYFDSLISRKVHTYIHTHVHTHIHTHTHTHIWPEGIPGLGIVLRLLDPEKGTYIHTYTHIHTYIHTHITYTCTHTSHTYVHIYHIHMTHINW
jgi:hypothetical protein